MAKAPTKASEVNLKESLAELNTIVKWFESQEEIDVEAGLEKVRRGAGLVKVCKERLTEIENEFEQIKRDAESESDTVASPRSVAAKSPSDEPGEDIDPDNIPF